MLDYGEPSHSDPLRVAVLRAEPSPPISRPWSMTEQNRTEVKGMIRMPGWLRRIPLTLVAFTALAALILTLWLPFGWKVTGLYEEWFLVSLADAGNPLRILYDPPYNESYRPLLLAPHVFAYLLTPNSFLGLNIIMSLCLWGKSAAMYSLVRRLVPDNPALAFVSA